MSKDERVALIEREGEVLPLSIQADLLGVSRSRVYYRQVDPTPEEIALKHRIDEIFTAHTEPTDLTNQLKGG